MPPTDAIFLACVGAHCLKARQSNDVSMLQPVVQLFEVHDGTLELRPVAR